MLRVIEKESIVCYNKNQRILLLFILLLCGTRQLPIYTSDDVTK